MEFDPQGSSSDLGNPTLNSIRNALVILKKSFSSRLPVCLAVNFSIHQWHTEELQRRFSPLRISAVRLARREDKDIFEEKQTSTWLTVVLYHGRRRRPSQWTAVLLRNITCRQRCCSHYVEKAEFSTTVPDCCTECWQTNTMYSGYNVIKGFLFYVNKWSEHLWDGAISKIQSPQYCRTLYPRLWKTPRPIGRLGQD